MNTTGSTAKKTVRQLMKGNEVIGEAAIRAGCRYYFGYPITPQSEISHYMAKYMPAAGGTFVQAESEVAAINMVYGAASAGARVMTSSSSPGISLKQEGISYASCAELPAVIVNIVRCGPGLGGILPAQSDYFQAVKGGGHGDYRIVVLAPCSVQELYELTVEAFNIADRYRVIVMIMGDGFLGQMMEVVEFKEREDIDIPVKDWAVTGTGYLAASAGCTGAAETAALVAGAKGMSSSVPAEASQRTLAAPDAVRPQRAKNIITSIYIDPEVLEKHNLKLQEKYSRIAENEVRAEVYNCDGADIILTAFGTSARIAKNVIKTAAASGIKVGLIRPITLWPFPAHIFEQYADTPAAFLSVEMNAGQMVEDVMLALNGKKPVYFYGRMGGMVPDQDEILAKIKGILASEKGGR